jgi:hypothetical protein
MNPLPPAPPVGDDAAVPKPPKPARSKPARTTPTARRKPAPKRPHALRALMDLARAADPPDTLPDDVRRAIVAARHEARVRLAAILPWLDEAPTCAARDARIARVTLWHDRKLVERDVPWLAPKPDPREGEP